MDLIRISSKNIRGVIFLMVFFCLPMSISVSADMPADDVHEVLFEETDFPSANLCKSCHPGHYKEWSASPHAYAVISPVSNAMQARVSQLTNGTNGDFCIRCHTPVGMHLNEPTYMSSLDRHPVSREGVTCVTCHRRPIGYGKVSGRLHVKPGDIFEPMYGSAGNSELKRVIESGEFQVNTDRKKSGRDIHLDAYELPQITTSAFCASCHDVNHVTGFRLEEAFSDYKSSPAARKGISCQDCHMGTDPGKPNGYRIEPIAVVAGKPTKPRKRTNHMFIGPDYSVVHPGLFPHNSEAQDIASLRDWLKFKFGEGWGTEEFEDNRPADYEFPKEWADETDRFDARAVLEENVELLEKAAIERKKLLQAGYQLGDIVIDRASNKGVKFRVQVRNATDGHNVPTGFDAERMVFLQVTVRDQNNQIVFESGDLDPNGDVRDSHSLYVHNGELPLDKYLYTLQSKFIVRMLKGGEREQVLAVNYSLSPTPFLRPQTYSTYMLGRPVGSRKHRRVIPPLRHQWAKYKISKAELENTKGPYKANIKLISGMVPVNLIDAIKDVGFDYGMTPREIADAVVAGHQVLWERNVILEEGVIPAKKINESQSLGKK